MDLMANNFSDGLKAPPLDDEVLKDMKSKAAG